MVSHHVFGHLVLLFLTQVYRPTLLDDLFTLIQSQMTVRYGAGAAVSPAIPLRRALEVLNQILKEFTSIKMLAGIDTTTKVTFCS